MIPPLIARRIRSMRVTMRKMAGSHPVSWIREPQPTMHTRSGNHLVMHDICHFIVETRLHIRDAFFGLVMAGVHPSDFEERTLRDAMNLGDDAWLVEYCTGILQMERAQGEVEDLNAVLHGMVLERHPRLANHVFTDAEVAVLRADFRKLADVWEALGEGEVLVLEFPSGGYSVGAPQAQSAGPRSEKEVGKGA